MSLRSSCDRAHVWVSQKIVVLGTRLDVHPGDIIGSARLPGDREAMVCLNRVTMSEDRSVHPALTKHAQEQMGNSMAIREESFDTCVPLLLGLKSFCRTRQLGVLASRWIRAVVWVISLVAHLAVAGDAFDSQNPSEQSFFRHVTTYLARPCATEATSYRPDTYQSNLPMVSCRCRVLFCAWEAGLTRQGPTIAHRVWKLMPGWQHDE
jgi:hypothetical protein